MNKVYVVIYDTASELGGSDCGARVYANREDAEAWLDAEYKQEKKENTGWYDKEEYAKGMYFEFWEDGSYGMNHYSMHIEEKEIL